MSASESVAEALARHARRAPEAPCLFFRDLKGRFRWRSYQNVAQWLEPAGRSPGLFSVKEVHEGSAVDAPLLPFLSHLAEEDAPVREASERLRALLSPERQAASLRDIWISWRPLSVPAEKAIARWAIISGAVVLVDPGERLHPDLFAWARPTLLSGSSAELLALAQALEAQAPRFLRGRWMRQRTARLRHLLVEGTGVSELDGVADVVDFAEVAAGWRELSPAFTAHVLPFPHAALV
ncbi:MAG: hypothetical protein ABI639_15380 [Thermoanaerobaculia bacterium]